MKRIKAILSAVLAVMICMGVCGCMRNQDKIDRMVSYINEKYADDTFVYQSMSGGHMGSNVTKIVVSSEKYPDDVIRVICSETDQGEVFSDTYLNIKFKEQTAQHLKSRLTEEYGENIYFKYIPDDVASMENGSSETTFKEYITEQDACIYFSAAVSKSVTDETADAEAERVKALLSDSTVSGHIYFIGEEVALTQADGETTAREYIREKKYDKQLYFIKKTVDEYTKIEWTDGK